MKKATARTGQTTRKHCSYDISYLLLGRSITNLQKYISSRFFENQPNGFCSHLSEKASKGRFLKPEKLQNHTNEEKGKEKKKSEEKERRRRKKKQWLHS